MAHRARAGSPARAEAARMGRARGWAGVVLPWVRAKRKSNAGLTRSVCPQEWPLERGERHAGHARRRAGAQDITTLLRTRRARSAADTKRAKRTTGGSSQKALLCSIAHRRFTPARLPKQSRLDAGFALPTHSATRGQAAKERCSLARRLPTVVAWEDSKRRDRRGDAPTLPLRSDLVIGNQSSASASRANASRNAAGASRAGSMRFAVSEAFCAPCRLVLATRCNRAGCVAVCTSLSLASVTCV